MLVLTFVNIRGQNSKKSFIELNFGLSKHGSGDLPGFNYGFSYGEEFTNRLYWQVGFEGSTNDKESLPLTVVDESGREFDSTPHKVISGFQLIGGIKYNVIESSKHQLGISLLGLGRYQATTINGTNAILFPAFTELPYPVRLYLRDGPSRTIAFGGSFRLGYQYSFGNNLFIGVAGALQTDTNSDTILSSSISFGKRF